MAHPDFPTLLSPLDLGPFSVPNRVIMGSMHLGWEEHRKGMEVLAKFYSERAEGGVGLIVTGGHSPNWEGTLFPGGARMAWAYHARKHRVIPQAVHAAGGRILLQLLHGGRSSYQPWCVSASALKSPINRFKPRALGNWGIRRTIKDFASAARWAQRAGYDGVEIMGSEGYLINQFLSPASNQRTDEWGGSVENRVRMAVEIVSQTRQAVGPSFLIMFRLSLADLVPGGSTWDEVCMMARALEGAGVNVFNTGIGWHESRVPTIATLVPPGAFAFATEKLRAEVSVPVVASNRFNTPEQCEAMLAAGQADLVSMARPFLADPRWVDKAASGKPEHINTCIGCNQSCLDHIFSGKTASCLVNPRAGWEHKYPPATAAVVRSPQRIAVVGAGPAGLACAAEAAALGHNVDLFDSASRPGGQFLLAQQIPGKGDFAHTLRYFTNALEQGRVTCHWGARITDFTGWELRYDALVLATGVKPRTWEVEGADHPMVVGYTELLEGRVKPGNRVAVIGAGGIGVDVTDFLTHDADEAGYHAVWGVDRTLQSPGALTPPVPRRSVREVTIFQRKPGKLGAGLGKTTGWIHRATLRQRGIQFASGVTYLRVDDRGLHYIDDAGNEQVASVDQVVVCVGQTPNLPPLASLPTSLKVHTIGGAWNAHKVDAARAIREGWELARSWH